MFRCVWCGKESSEVKEIMVLSTNRVVANRHEIPLFVCPEHEEKLRKSYDRERRHGRLHSVLCNIVIALLISAIITMYMDKYMWLPSYLLQTATAVMALRLIVFPFGYLGVGVNFISIATFIKLQRIMGGIGLALMGITIVSMC